MRLIEAVILFMLALLLSGCGNDGLGMKVEIVEVAVPVKNAAIVAKEQAGSLNIAVCGVPAAQGQMLIKALAVAFNAKKPPAGDLTFTKLSVRNRSMEHPARASAEIDATCIWTEADGETIGFEITVRTYSISLENESQLKYLRDEALTGMVHKLAKNL